MKKLTILLALFSTIAISSTSVLASASTDIASLEKTTNTTNVSYLPTTNGYVNANAVVFRSGTNFDSDIIDLLNKGTPITITGSTFANNYMWAKVTYNGISGYIGYTYVSYN